MKPSILTALIITLVSPLGCEAQEDSFACEEIAAMNASGLNIGWPTDDCETAPDSQVREAPAASTPAGTSAALSTWLAGKQLVMVSADATTSLNFCSDGRFVQAISGTMADATGSLATGDVTLGLWRVEGEVLYMFDPVHGADMGEVGGILAVEGDIARWNGLTMRVRAPNPYCQ